MKPRPDSAVRWLDVVELGIKGCKCRERPSSGIGKVCFGFAAYAPLAVLSSPICWISGGGGGGGKGGRRWFSARVWCTRGAARRGI